MRTVTRTRATPAPPTITDAGPARARPGTWRRRRPRQMHGAREEVLAALAAEIADSEAGLGSPQALQEGRGAGGGSGAGGPGLEGSSESGADNKRPARARGRMS